MSDSLDTNVVVRYLTQDPPDQGRAATEIIDNDSALQVSAVALLEAAYVLRTEYNVERVALVDYLVELVQKRNITVSGLEKRSMVQALLMCRP